MGDHADRVRRRGAAGRGGEVGKGKQEDLGTRLLGEGFAHIMAALSLSALPSRPCIGSGGDEGVREVGGALHA